jgi:hypothetical protein
MIFSGHITYLYSFAQHLVSHPAAMTYIASFLNLFAGYHVPLELCAHRVMLDHCDQLQLSTYFIMKASDIGTSTIVNALANSVLYQRSQHSILSSADAWGGDTRLIEIDTRMYITMDLEKHINDESASQRSTRRYLNSCPSCKSACVTLTNHVGARRGSEDIPAWSAVRAHCKGKCGWFWNGVQIDESPANLQYVGKTHGHNDKLRFVFESAWPHVLLFPESPTTRPQKRIRGKKRKADCLSV